LEIPGIGGLVFRLHPKAEEAFVTTVGGNIIVQEGKKTSGGCKILFNSLAPQKPPLSVHPEEGEFTVDGAAKWGSIEIGGRTGKYGFLL